ncbi:MAG: hypothetical protein PHC61_11380, partial [Chitinivibrionales bacterium]|nr:hypothetical protein [Chitinivibrionales bacterium]
LVELTVCKLACMEQSVSVEEVLAALKASAAGQSPPPEKKKHEDAVTRSVATPQIVVPAFQDVPAPAAAPSGPAGDDGISFPAAEPGGPDIVKAWPDFLDMMMHHRPTLATFLAVATIASSSDTIVDIRFSSAYKFHFTEVTKKPNRDEIVKTLREFTGRPLDIHITIEPAGNRPGPAPSAPTPLASLNDEIEQEPIIKSILKTFDGEVIG